MNIMDIYEIKLRYRDKLCYLNIMNIKNKNNFLKILDIFC